MLFNALTDMDGFTSSPGTDGQVLHFAAGEVWLTEMGMKLSSLREIIANGISVLKST